MCRKPWLGLAAGVALSFGAGPGLAAGENWVIQMKASDASWTNANAVCVWADGTGYSDGFVAGEDIPYVLPPPGRATVAILQPTWAGTPPFYRADKRYIVGDYETKVWANIRFWLSEGYADTEARLALYIPTAYPLKNHTYGLIVVHDPTATYVDNTVLWEGGPGIKGGSSTAPLYYAAWAGDAVTQLQMSDAAAVMGGVELKLVVAPVPEPSVALALMLGAGGVTTALWRRRT